MSTESIGEITLSDSGNERTRFFHQEGTARRAPSMLGTHRVSVLVPCRDEADNLPIVLPQHPRLGA